MRVVLHKNYVILKITPKERHKFISKKIYCKKRNLVFPNLLLAPENNFLARFKLFLGILNQFLEKGGVNLKIEKATKNIFGQKSENRTKEIKAK